MSLFPRIVASEFAPVFRLLDEVTAYRAPVACRQGVRSYQPRFDVKENRDSYELQGELPGVEQNDIQVEWTDQNVLSIKGRTERHREDGTRPAAIESQQTEQPKAVEATESETSSTYQKASVEEETDGFTNISSPNQEATPAETPATTATEAVTAHAAEASNSNSSRYWVSERSVGSFSRTFKFPNRIDQEHVKASLKNGILSILIPKAAAPEHRRINVE